MTGEGRDPIARAYIEIKARRDHRMRDELRREGQQAGQAAGQAAGQSYGEQFWRSADGRLRDSKGRFVKVGTEIGADMGAAAGNSWSQKFWTASGSGLPGAKGRHVRSAAAIGGDAGKAWSQSFNDWASKGTSKVGGLIDGLGTKIGKIKPLWAFGGAAAVSGIGPLAGAFATAAVNAGQFAVEVAPLVATLPAVAAGGFLISKALGAIGPAMSKELSPVTKGFKAATDEAARLATVGIRPLATEFDRVNMPFVEKAMRRIGLATNFATFSYLDFLNSVEGTKAVKEVTGETAGFFERLAPDIEAVAESATRLAERVAGVTFDKLGDGADWAAEKITKFFDSITDKDVENAFDRVGGVVGDVRDGVLGVVHALQWLDDHRAEISKASDVISLGLIGIGLATGNLPLAAGAAVTLTIRHWDDLKEAWRGVQDEFEGNNSLTDTADSLQRLWGHAKQAWNDFKDDVGPEIGPFLDRLADAFRDMQPAIVGWSEVLGPAVEVLGDLLASDAGHMLMSLGLLATAMGKVAYASASMSAQVLDAFAAMTEPLAAQAQRLHLPFADSMAAFAQDARTAADRVQMSLDDVKADQARDEIKDLQGTINRLKGRKVKTEADKQLLADSKARIRELRREIAELPAKKAVGIVATYRLNIIAALKNAAREAGYGFGSVPSYKRAAGGLMEGPGTGTSDSIPAMLSHREYVQSNAAVEHYGVAAMDAINQRRVPKAALRLASGGLASLTRDATIAMGELSESKPARIARAAAAMQPAAGGIDADALGAVIATAVEQGIKRGMKRMAINMDGAPVARVVEKYSGRLL
ncbi:hypothetical protein ACIB24_12530 [Spongisporangium articulatum]|uniref:Uncharacterized protein n=1 Tax=Spongisporangium articulatum TaxID=3362603 RepID=A0ABW8AND8_9ACTN